MSLSIQTIEPDDYLHNPDPAQDRDRDRGGHICTTRGIANLAGEEFVQVFSNEFNTDGHTFYPGDDPY